MVDIKKAKVLFVIPNEKEFVNLLDPDYIPGVRHIARALTTINRYSGRCDPFYSVAGHSYVLSIMANNIWGEKEAAYALIHDCAEMFAGDVPSPIKKLSGSFIEEFEKEIIFKVWNRYFKETHGELDKETTNRVHNLEKSIAHLEMEIFLQSYGVEPYHPVDIWENCFWEDMVKELLREHSEVSKKEYIEKFICLSGFLDDKMPS